MRASRFWHDAASGEVEPVRFWDAASLPGYAAAVAAEIGQLETTMPLRIHDALERWRAAERALAAAPVDSPGRHDAEDAVVAAREEYVATVRIVAEEQGPAAMPDLTETQVHDLGTDHTP